MNCFTPTKEPPAPGTLISVLVKMRPGYWRENSFKLALIPASDTVWGETFNTLSAATVRPPALDVGLVVRYGRVTPHS